MTVRILCWFDMSHFTSNEEEIVFNAEAKQQTVFWRKGGNHGDYDWFVFGLYV